jgi:uncharacterized membrane protein YkvA (DUF1232 family)
MSIIIKDDQGLDTALMMDGYTGDQRMEAKQAIRSQFRDAETKVLQEVLDMPLPETITVNMAISKNEELKGESAARLASFNAELSRDDSFNFTILEITVKKILDHSDLTLFQSTVIHEMFHAADLSMLEESQKLFNGLYGKINDGYSSFSKYESDGSIALLKTLQMFNHYRAEGVAILGECLLMKSKFGAVDNATAQFCKVFEMVMVRAQMRINGHQEEERFDKEVFHRAYAVAPIILLLVLGKKGDIKEELAIKALHGLDSGMYDLTDSETITIMRSALALNLTGYIQGLVSLGDQVAPLRPFLNFCTSLQHDSDEDNTNAYERLVNQPRSAESFYAAMSQIMGSCMDEEELDALYEGFITNTSESSSYPQVKEKVTTLYNIFKTDGNQDRRRLAQWALTYFFDDEDIIHDDVSGLGFVDDVTIIDYAISLLQKF